ncbi:MAG: hypothetical protein OXJ52_02610 [Oligoflexia bacterium]|nr:hypothetical protein [Oligoflexia bacterium]
MSIPSSKAKDDPNYDRRFEDLFAELKKAMSNLIIETPIIVKKTILASRHMKHRLKPEDLKQNYTWKGFKTNPKGLFIFDDTIISGSHFRAVSEFLKDNGYKGKILGVFWAKAKEDYEELYNY